MSHEDLAEARVEEQDRGTHERRFSMRRSTVALLVAFIAVLTLYWMVHPESEDVTVNRQEWEQTKLNSSKFTSSPKPTATATSSDAASPSQPQSSATESSSAPGTPSSSPTESETAGSPEPSGSPSSATSSPTPDAPTTSATVRPSPTAPAPSTSQGAPSEEARGTASPAE